MSNSAPFLLALALLSTAPTAPRAGHAAQKTDGDPAEAIRFVAGLAEKGLHDLVVQEARRFLDAHPRHEGASVVRYRMAGALWELGRRAEAEREYETLAGLERFEYRAEALFRCGEAARARGDARRERAALEAVLDAGQDYLRVPALLALADLDARSGRLAEAERRYSAVLEVGPESAEAPLARRGLVWCAIERRDLDEAAARARRFLRLDREGVHADELRLLLGDSLLGADPPAALEAFRAIRSPELAEPRQRGVAFALSALGRHAQAAEAFEQLQASDPAGPLAREAALQAGIAHLRAEDPRAAVRRLGALSEPDAEALYWLARAQRASGEDGDALATLERAARERPTGELAQRLAILRGDCCMALGRPDEARAAYEASGSRAALHAAAVAALNQGDAPVALRLADALLSGAADAAPRDPAAQGARVVRAEALFALQRTAEAERALEAAREHPADSAEGNRLASRLAWCRYLAGDLAGARARFQALAERAAGEESEEALAMLIRIAGEEGRNDLALTPARSYLERHPEGRFADAAHLALARQSSADQRRTRLAEWLARFPDSASRAAVQLELAELEGAAGEPGRAERRFQEVLEESPSGSAAANALYGLAWSAWERADHAACEQALARLAALPELDPLLREAGLELGCWSRVARGALDEAVAEWRELARAGSEERRTSAARRIAAALADQARGADAERLLVECLRGLRSAPLAAELELERAYLALGRNDPAAAAALLGRAREAGADASGVAEASYHLGVARLAAGDPSGARAAFVGATSVEHPRAAEALQELGLACLAGGELEEAERAFARLLAEQGASPLASEARFLLGECAFRRGDHGEAARRLAAARDGGAAGDVRARVLFRLGLSLGHLGRWSECEPALAELARAFPAFPNLAEGELWRGRALAALGKARAARAALERALALDSGELAAGARLELGRLAEGEGRLEDALSEYLKVALLYAHEELVGAALFGAGRVLEAQGAPEQAAARYRELVSEHAASADAPRARERLRALGER